MPTVPLDSARASDAEISVGPVAEHGTLRVVKFRIGCDEFAVLSFAKHESPECSSPAGTRDHRPQDGADPTLTAAERVIVELAVSGLSNQAIAEKRGTSVRTIANQLAAIYKKLGISSRAELAIWQLGSSGPGPP